MQWLVCRSSQWFHDRHGGIIISHWILCVMSLPRLLAVLLFTFITNPKFCSLLKKLFHRVDHFSVCFLLLSHFLFPFLSHMLFSFLLFVSFSGSFPNPFFTHLSSSFSFSHSSSSYYYYYPFLSFFPSSCFHSPTSVSDDEARQSLVELAAAQCCWDSKFAREMDIISVTPANAFHVNLIIIVTDKYYSRGICPGLDSRQRKSLW